LQLSHLVDLIVVVHRRNKLENMTVNATSRACSESRTVAANLHSLDQCRIHTRNLGGELKKLLDTNERTDCGTSCLFHNY
ncbi:hypothetical protein HYPSUDRAFT_148787, partial [Hypholoma sublateritium FD-334 SS-4]